MRANAILVTQISDVTFSRDETGTALYFREEGKSLIDTERIIQVAPVKTLVQGHPCQLPLAFCDRLIRMASDPGDTVLDPFAGSGSVLVAAKEAGRKFVGFEIRKDYCAMAEARLSGVTEGL